MKKMRKELEKNAFKKERAMRRNQTTRSKNLLVTFNVVSLFAKVAVLESVATVKTLLNRFHFLLSFSLSLFQ